MVCSFVLPYFALKLCFHDNFLTPSYSMVLLDTHQVKTADQMILHMSIYVSEYYFTQVRTYSFHFLSNSSYL